MKEDHPNWRHPEVAGEFITLQELLERWRVNKRFLWMLAQSGDLRPWQDGNAGTLLPGDNGTECLYFLPPSGIHDFPGDAVPHEEIPDGASFFLPDVCDYEERNSNVLKDQRSPHREDSMEISREGTNSDSGRNKPRTRRTRITGAIEAAFDALRKTLARNPTADQVFSYLENSDETGIIVDATTDALIWQDTRGKFHETKRKTIANKVSSLSRDS